jgi:hypothetical protein
MGIGMILKGIKVIPIFNVFIFTLLTIKKPKWIPTAFQKTLQQH